MKTTKDIIKRLHELEKAGMEELMAKMASTDLFNYLSFDEAYEFLDKEQIAKETEAKCREDWSKDVDELTEENVINKIKNYMIFALDKAGNHRGLSAQRSIAHFEHWLWLLEDKETLGFITRLNYTNYGCPILKKICEKYGMEYPIDEKMQRMARGEPCCPGCQEGCG
jgi:hypothetical protein